MRFYAILFMLFLAGCGSSTPPNQWQFDSSSNFEEYKNSYLKGEEDLAKDFLEKAIKSAKSSSNLETLASIELGRVALRIALFKPPKFEEYKKLEPLIESKELKSYAKLLAKKLSPGEVKYLPKKYKRFALAYLRSDFISAKKRIKEIKSPISKMVVGALIKEHLDDKTIAHIVDSISFYGYRVAVLEWMKFWVNHTKNERLKKILKKKLAILNG
jgi:hypothetical protein